MRVARPGTSMAFAGGRGAAAAAVLLAGAAAARGADASIEMFAAAFLPSSATIDAGDPVTWIWRKGDHVLASGLPGGAPGTPGEPGALFEAPLDAGHPSFRFAFPAGAAGSYPFFCRLHPAQVGYIEVSTGEMSFRVAVVDDMFNPDEVDIFEGDSVRWEHEPGEGRHTVTSGRSSRPADVPGALFDAESSDSSPVFAFRFDAPGEYPYFCRPHEDMGMKGVVRVQRRFVRGDATGDGLADLSDAVAALAHLFLAGPDGGCPAALDADGDGALDIADPIYLLGYLFLAGPPPPRPFPARGPDRSGGALRCGP